MKKKENTKKSERRPWNVSGFSKVPLDETNNLDEWHGNHLTAYSISPNEFEAWITATDAPPALRELGPSVCAWQLRPKGTSTFLPPERWPGRPVESDESKGYVAAVAGVLDRVPVGSKVIIYCRADWIVNAINRDLYKWEKKGELDGKRPYCRIWRHILERIREISSDPTDISAALPTAADNEIIKLLKKSAREARPKKDGKS